MNPATRTEPWNRPRRSRMLFHGYRIRGAKMNKGLLVSTAIGLLLAGGAARAQPTAAQNQDDTWDGPGYYAEYMVTDKSGASSLTKLGGPFPSQDACQAYLNQQGSDQGVYSGTFPGGNAVSKQCVYRGSTVSYAEGCFLTTACVEYAGLADNCDELMLMRALRDRYLARFQEGRLVIDQYYRVAPRIVERIRQAPDRQRILRGILGEVRATAHAVSGRDFEIATARYAAMVSRLQQRYGVI
ncbi:MAG: hypothetical protein KGJ78_11675 [Alphaproteobacteria bacterium]|nr:hypothetical protein [Alphaproteobacteria bacterium]